MRYLLFILLVIIGPVYGQTTQNTSDFVITIKTDNINLGSSNKTSFNIPTRSGNVYNYKVDWNNDGKNISTSVTGDINHDFGIAGTYTIRISGIFPQISFNTHGSLFTDNSKLLSIEQWGTNNWSSFNYAFFSCTRLVINALDNPDLTNVSDLSYMFQECNNINSNVGNWNTSTIKNMSNMFLNCTNFNQDIGKWNTSAVTDMTQMFRDCPNFNQDIGNWNTTSVKNMSLMFYNCSNFNQDIGNWNTSNVTNMRGMFNACGKFNKDIGNWNTSAVNDMSYMLCSCSVFNQNIGRWNTTNVVNMSNMFGGCFVFNQDIGKWNTSNVTNMSSMFYNCTIFNEDIGNWNTSNVTDINSMFNSCTNFDQNIRNWNTSKVTNMSGMFLRSNFNQDIGNWNTSAVTDMTQMFRECPNFNQNIGNWNTSNVTDMLIMFYYSTAFNQSIAKWNIGKVADMTSMLNGVGMSFNNYDATLIGWQASAHQSNITLGADGLTYCAAADKHDLLTNNSGWIITGDNYLNTATIPRLVVTGTMQTTNTISCIDASSGFMQFLNNIPSPTFKYLAIKPNSNTGYNFSVTAANNLPIIYNQMRTDGTTNTTALSNRIYTIIDAGTNNYLSGMTVRIYYSPTDSTYAMSSLDTKVKSPITSQWFKFSGTTHTANVNNILANQTINNITGATFLTPSAYGTENNTSYVEFSNIKNFGSFGFLAARTAYVLPITLTSFTAVANKCAVSLVWKVAHEENSNYYAVETSKNGKDFTQVAKVTSNNSVNGGTYNYDYVTDNSTHYFRLRSVDFDGKFTYSQIDIATTNCTNVGGVTVSPNPASEQILIQGLANGSYITLHDLMGKIIIKTKVSGTNETINIGKYAKGIYLLNVKAFNGEIKTLKVVKQ